MGVFGVFSNEQHCSLVRLKARPSYIGGVTSSARHFHFINCSKSITFFSLTDKIFITAIFLHHYYRQRYKNRKKISLEEHLLDVHGHQTKDTREKMEVHKELILRERERER